MLMQAEEIVLRYRTPLMKKMATEECCRALVMHLLTPRTLGLWTWSR